MIELILFWAVGVCGVLVFAIWGMTKLIEKRKISKGKMVIKFHYQDPNGKLKVTDVTINRKDYFNVSQKDLDRARKYVQEAIENGELKLGTTLEQSCELIKEEREKDEEENSKT